MSAACTLCRMRISPVNLAQAFSVMSAMKMQALIVLPDAMFIAQRQTDRRACS
jgi:hypothetical protein